MSLVLIDLEVESESGEATADNLGQASLGRHCHLDLNTVKAENKDQHGDQENGGDNAEKIKCKKANVSKKAKDAKKTKGAQKTKDAKKTKDAQKAKDAQKTKDAEKTKDAKNKIARDKQVVKNSKWGTVRRVVQALTPWGPATSTSPHDSDDIGCDDISFDGHLFEYAPQPTIIPKVAVPRLHLRPTLRERLCNMAHNLFRCGSLKQNNQYTMD